MNKLLTFLSDSHQELYDLFFYPSYKKYLDQDFELIVEKIDQLCPNGNFGDSGFDITMLKKIELISKHIDINSNDILLFADIDIQFFQAIDLSFITQSYDIYFQQDYFDNYICAGLFIAKQNINTSKFFNSVFHELKSKINGKIDDQTIINKIKHEIKYRLLPSDEYWTVANSTKGSQWNPGVDFDVPKNIIAHHANWTIGVQNKIKLMNLTKEKLICTE
jgi:hypothetical protein